MSTETPRQSNQPATWAEYHDTKTYHSRGRTRIRAVEKPLSVKATARTYRREPYRTPGGKPLPRADLQRGGIRSPLAFPPEQSELVTTRTPEPRPVRPGPRGRILPLAAIAAVIAGGAFH